MPELIECQKCGSKTSDLTGGLCGNCQLAESATVSPQATPPIRGEATIAPGSGPGNQGIATRDFGDYELLNEIARGGMGVVYKARHKTLNRITAVKMIIGGRFSSDEELQRFHVEAEAAAKLDHPGIVPLYEIGEYDGQAFFAMKFIEGGSLAQKLDHFREDPRQAVDMMAQVSRAVHHAHQRGILHRDLKPANVLIDEDMQPLITDLGLAKSTAGNSNLTHTGAVLGTPSYMPPEQAAGQDNVTTAADVYALGAIMYELLTGMPPHKGDTAVETVMRVLNDTPAEPRKVDKSVDYELELICLKCLERDPADRYNSAGDLAEDLEHWLAGDAISVKPPSFWFHLSRWLRTNRRVVYVAFAILIGLLFALPVILAFIQGSSNDNLYDYFPDDPKPWFTSIPIPDWVTQAAFFLLLVAVWPSLGLWNALVAKPKTNREAVGVGVLTSLMCLVIVVGLLGWLGLIILGNNYSRPQIQTLAEALWLPDGVTQDEAHEKALALYTNLKDVPENERANALTARMGADQIANGPMSLLGMGVICLVFAIPVVYGTVIGTILLKRGNRFWLVLIRYGAGWLALTMALVFVAALVFDGNVNTIPARDTPVRVLSFALVAATICFLILRRWRKQS
ncbi:MAG: serine/threonine-protein kinase [Pirellulaceae bacterium]